jgi:putative ABC transport system permease protein
MLYGDTVKIALGSLRVNKLRSGLTMFGITIGVFSIVGVMTIITALRSSIETGISFLGANYFQFAKYPVSGEGGGGGRRKYEMRRDITLPQAERYKRLMEGQAQAVCLKVFERNAVVQGVYNGRKTLPGVQFVGSDEQFIVTNQYSIGQGRNFTPADVELARPVIIIGLNIQRRLFPAENPLGKVIKMHDHAYTVVGVFAEKGVSFGNSGDEISVIPVTRFFVDYGAERRTVNIATQAFSQAVYNDTLDKGVTAMRIVRGLQPENENDFEVYSNDSLIAAFGQVADAVAKGSFVISAIALVAAGIGIMNIMLVSVTERTKEIGIRKSIGARKKSILLQFLLEAVSISLVGGLVGIALGVAAGNGFAMMLQASIIFPWVWAGIGLAVCCGIGIGFGFYPAWKAASLDPIEALRYE